MKTLTIEIDNSCKQCQEALWRIKNWDRRNEKVYGSVSKKTGKPEEIMVPITKIRHTAKGIVLS
jgi:hypothetical protein